MLPKNSMSLSLGLLISGVLVGCAGSSVKTERLVPAEYQAGRTLKSVAILPFSRKGRADEESTSAILSTVTGVKVEGKRYFSVAERARLASVINEQKYASTGQFDRKTAVEIGKKMLVQSVLFGQISDTGVTRKSAGKNDDKQSCTRYSMQFEFTPRFVNVRTGRVEFAPTIAESASQTICGRGSVDESTLRSEARKDALLEFRNLIAPRRISESLTLLTKYCEEDGGGRMKRMMSTVVNTPCDDSFPPEDIVSKVSSGQKFATSGRMDRACELWGEASRFHEAGFNLPYLLGVCAETLDENYTKALNYYKVADRRTTEPVKAINKALDRVASKTSDNLALGKKPKRKPDQKTLNSQRSLTELGYDPGPTDGFMGNKTRDAIREFQLDNGLGVTGVLDRSTLNALGN